MPNATSNRPPASPLLFALCWWGLAALVCIGTVQAEPAVHQSQLYRAGRIPQVQDAASRRCRSADMVGTWELVGFGSQRDLSRADAPYLFAYQVFRFESDGTMRSAHSRTAFVESPDHVLARIPTNLTYHVAARRDGLLTIIPQGQAEAAETWTCRRLTIDQIDLPRRTVLRRGDLVLTLLSKRGLPLFTRHLRRH